MTDKIKNFLITKNFSIKDAMRQMDKSGEKILFVVDSNKELLGTLTDGDIRRWVLANGSLIEEVGEAYNTNSSFVKQGYNIKDVKRLMLTKKIEWIPVIDEKKNIIEVLLWEEVFSGVVIKPKKKLDLPVVIMAGGKGSRLDPFTQILPKPLIPIDGEPIIKIIMDKLNQYGAEQFFVSIGHRSKMIKAYFEEKDTGYDIHYIVEDKELGTAGCLRSLIDKVKGSVLVTNCDIIIENDYSEIVKFHEKNKNDITIVGSFRHYTVPYGICDIEDGGTLKQIKEKPEYDFLINAGMYILKNKALGIIPKGEVFHMTDLIKMAQSSSMKVKVFPISEKSWLDIGEWEKYKEALKNFEV